MRNLLGPAFQPICCAQTGVVSHYEALARIRRRPHSDGHHEMLQAAEQFGYIGEIDMAMLEMAIEQGRRQQMTVAVNLSVRTIEGHVDGLINKLTSLGSACRHLVLEITETQPITDLGKVVYFSLTAQTLGCRIAVDDFGNTKGHFSAATASKLRPDYLKIDGGVLANAYLQGNSTDIYRINEFAKAIGATVIGEYVDSMEKLSLLRHAGVKYAQGWLFGKASFEQFVVPALL